MRNRKLVVGLVLVVIALVLFFLWEARLSQVIGMERVAVAAGDIYAGDVISQDSFRVKPMSDDDLIRGHITEEEAAGLVGSTAMEYVPEGAQLHPSYFSSDGGVEIASGQSIYCISEDMIDMVSSSLRRGDKVRIYGNDGREDLGTYTVAFVKDQSGREVKNDQALYQDRAIDRESSNYSVSSLEIICSRADYESIISFTELSNQGLTIVQEV